MNTRFQKQWTKNVCLTFAIFSMATMANAQQTTGNFAKKLPASLNGTVRVVDNKGTIKYLQSKNGITMLTNASADVTTTTWQLGGTLTDDTYIDVDGKVFGLDKIALATAGSASTDATDKSVHGTGTGWTLLVRDEATGAIQKLKATDLITSGHEKFIAAAIPLLLYPLTGSPILPDFKKVWVYRNGVKLVAGEDYTISASTVTLVPNATVPNDWTVNAGDVIEVQYFK
jgi:hypothetical protein